jgi:hypothetical protein
MFNRGTISDREHIKWAHFYAPGRVKTGLSAAIPHKEGACALFAAGFPLQSLARKIPAAAPEVRPDGFVRGCGASQLRARAAQEFRGAKLLDGG